MGAPVMEYQSSRFDGRVNSLPGLWLVMAGYRENPGTQTVPIFVAGIYECLFPQNNGNHR